MVAKIFDKLMGYSLSDFPKSEVELVRFRTMLEILRVRSEIEGGNQALLDSRLYDSLIGMEVQHFPKTLGCHMVFNGWLLELVVARKAA